MIDDILPVPPLPDALREAAQIAKLIPFIGAGASRLAGCPSWAEFSDGALRCFVAHGKFSHAQLAQIGSLNPRVKLSLALALQKEHGVQIDFRKLLHPRERKDHEFGRHLYAGLFKLGTTFVTTNYDEWLDDELATPSPGLAGTVDPKADPLPRSRTVFHKVHDLTAANLNRSDAVIHLHGSLKDPAGMILTTEDYTRHYANDRPPKAENLVITFLQNLFREKTVLFIGYGLEELEILEYMLGKRRDAGNQHQSRHFLLQGFFSHERELMRSLKAYYRQCGIELLPFLRDHKDWEQLLDVIETYAQQIPASTLMVLQEFKEMEDYLDD